MSICLRRREFVAGLGGVAAWPALGMSQTKPKYTGRWERGGAIHLIFGGFSGECPQTAFEHGSI